MPYGEHADLKVSSFEAHALVRFYRDHYIHGQGRITRIKNPNRVDLDAELSSFSAKLLNYSIKTSPKRKLLRTARHRERAIWLAHTFRHCLRSLALPAKKCISTRGHLKRASAGEGCEAAGHGQKCLHMFSNSKTYLNKWVQHSAQMVGLSIALFIALT